MGRLVRIPRAASTALDGRSLERLAGQRTTVVRVEDDYLLRLAKYVPAEVLAFSVLINAILEQALANSGSAATMAGMPVMGIATAALIVGTIMAPFFVWYVHEEDDAWVTNACVSFVAFPFWSYAMGAVAFRDYWDGNLAAMLLASFTVASGLIKPLPVQLPRAAEAAQPESTQTSEPAAQPAPAPARLAATPGPRLVELTPAINMPGP